MFYCRQILPDEALMRRLIEQDAPIAEIKKLFRKRYED
jgi:4-hydroxy-4-methyl-2-oxoglutarate aldolase